MARGDEPGMGDQPEQFGDLFDDLDRFFDDDEPERTGPPGSEGPAGSFETGEGTPPAASDQEDTPDDRRSDIDDLGPEEADQPSEEDPGSGGTEPPAGHAADHQQDVPEWRGEATAEMSTHDWSRLRDVLGDETQDEEFSFLTEQAPGSEEGLFPGFPLEEEPSPAPGASGESPGELTIDDLRKAPDIYRDLPAGDEPLAWELPEAGPAGEETAGEPEGPGEAADWAPPESSVWREPEAAEESEPWRERAAAEDTGAWREPAIAEVEAAADQLVEEFGPGVGAEDQAPAPWTGDIGGETAPPPFGQEQDFLEGELGAAPSPGEDLLAGLSPPEPPPMGAGRPEGMIGPSWEEPTSRPVVTEPSPPGAEERNLPMAVFSAAALIAVALITLAFAKWLFAIVAGGVALLGQAELYATMHRRGHQPATALGLVVGGLVMAAAYFKGESGMLFVLPLGLILTFLWYMVAAPKAREGLLQHVASTLLGVVYVPFLAGFVLLILTIPTSGRAIMVSVLGLTVLYDMAAFAIGSYWGTRALAPSISPRKSWEGLAGATLLLIAPTIAFISQIGPLDVQRSMALFGAVVVFAPLGDLAESALKRDLGVKDMGSVLPGHGGILDRIDSILFVAPAAFYILRLIF